MSNKKECWNDDCGRLGFTFIGKIEDLQKPQCIGSVKMIFPA